MMNSAVLRGVITLAACFVTPACFSPKATGRAAPGATITFHNQGRDRIQVYLVGEKHDWLIGRVEPRQTAHLALPQFGIASTPQAVALAVVPGWSGNLQPRLDPRTTFSIDEVNENLAGEEWVFVDGRLNGPVRGRRR